MSTDVSTESQPATMQEPRLADVLAQINNAHGLSARKVQFGLYVEAGPL